MKAKIIAICAALVWSLSLTGTTSAAETRDYKTAAEECFWGLILTHEDQRGLSLGLNIVSGAFGLYAYSSATSSADSFCAEKITTTASFINDSYPALVEDTARGSGQHLIAVLELAGCTVEDQQIAIPLVREDMAKAISAPGYEDSQYIDKVYSMFQSVNLRTQQACNIG